MVLLSVLGALGIIYIIVVQMSADVLFTSQYYNTVLFKEKAYYISRSAFTGLQDLFLLDDADVDSYHDMWASELPYDMEDEQVKVSIKIEDQERFINPNILLSGTVPDKKSAEIVRRMFTNMQAEPDLANAIADWIDDDEEQTIPLGADGMDYPPEMPAKNGPMDSLEELKLIKGLEEFYQGRVIMGKAYPGLKDLMTVHSNGKININTASSDILLCLDDEMNQDIVSEILRVREEEPIKKIDDLVDLAGMNYDLIYRIKKFTTVKSNNFKATITVESYDGRNSASLIVIFSRSKKGGKVKFWQAE